MSYETFYRKYRSQTFSEIVGQDHIKTTLENAIKSDRLSHAYIFSGPRGTGKTSTARILAKTLNCKQKKDTIPCLKCDICTSIAASSSVDVIEIDAASHTGVDNIRELNEKIYFMPVECDYKMYIIDEVHMLSTGAFNALLKTLEEPPEKTLFILATTEPHKIPVTIHSRCQHLHFRNLSMDEIIRQLTHITTQEGITAETKGLHTIARNAGGCMRDALSLLNHVVAYKGNDVAHADVLEVLGSTDDSQLLALIEAIIGREEPTIVTEVQSFVDSGINILQLVSELLTTLHRLILVKHGLKDSVSCDEQTLLHLQNIAKKVSSERLHHILDVMATTESELKWFSRPDILLHIRCLSAANPPLPLSTQTPPSTKSTPSVMTKKEPPLASPSKTTATPASITSPQKIKQTPQETPQHPSPKNTSDQDKWNTALSKIQYKKSALYGVLKSSQVVEKKQGALVIRLKQDFKFFREKICETHNLQFINSLLTQVFDETLSLTLYSKEAPTPPPVEENKKPSTDAEISEKKMPSTPPEVPVEQRINEVVKIFEGAII